MPGITPRFHPMARAMLERARDDHHERARRPHGELGQLLDVDNLDTKLRQGMTANVRRGYVQRSVAASKKPRP